MEKSLAFYQEALVDLPQDIKIMLSIARLHLLTGDLDHCFQMCQNVLMQDHDNDMATLVGLCLFQIFSRLVIPQYLLDARRLDVST